MPSRRALPLLTVLALACGIAEAVPAAPAVAQQADSTWVSAFPWRSIGPAAMGGRVTDVEGIPSPSHTFYVGTATGGIWKTTNGGITFTPVFDDQAVTSIGDLAIAPSDTSQIWAGTGEANVRNTVLPGGGVYKSVDGGATWKLMGLEGTQQIGRVVVDPTNPDIVFVAALGPVWKPDPHRGLYRTTDGGQSWKRVAFVDDSTGFIDVALDPRNPREVLASSWQVARTAYSFASGGKGSGLWRSEDGGDTWTQIRGGGFPSTEKGRIGIAIAPSDPRIVYASVEADSVPGGNGLLSGLYRSADGGATWTRTSAIDNRPFYFSQVRVDPRDPNRVFWSSTPVRMSEDGGRTSHVTMRGIHPDHHAMWIDPADPRHIVVGNDGGVDQSWDGGATYDYLNSIPLGQFNAVSFDMSVPYRVCGGLQDNGSWCGPSRKRRTPIVNADWFRFYVGDGFFTAQVPDDPRVLYGETQVGGVGRVDPTTGKRQPFHVSADTGAAAVRFNWRTPFLLSSHDPWTLYVGGSRVLELKGHGTVLRRISPDLSKGDTARIDDRLHVGGITKDPGRAETYGTVVALAESPLRAGLLFAGTDDGNLWLTRDDGGSWENLTGRCSGVPKWAEVSGIEPSHFDSLTFYVTFDDHKEDDFAPYVYVTTDLGKTFHSITADLPTGGVDFVRVIREDPVWRDLLYAGTAQGVYVSRDRGSSWRRFMTGMPDVLVMDLQVQPRDHELIAATHGRSLWISDVGPLEQLTPEALAAPAYLFAPSPGLQYDEPLQGGAQFVGDRGFRGVSPEYGAKISYRLGSAAPGDSVRIRVLDAGGTTVRTLTGPGGAGIHHVVWDYHGQGADSTKTAAPGSYTVELRAAGEVLRQPLKVIRK
jgi:photosystem II stability/assembly factor-like uncharacterized protein